LKVAMAEVETGRKGACAEEVDVRSGRIWFKIDPRRTDGRKGARMRTAATEKRARAERKSTSDRGRARVTESIRIYQDFMGLKLDLNIIREGWAVERIVDQP
jgi:hypothetical protein